MTTDEYQAFLADPLHREFVQEHERRAQESKAENRDIYSKRSEVIAQKSADRLREIERNTDVMSYRAESIENSIEFNAAIIALVLIAGFAAVVASLEGWW